MAETPSGPTIDPRLRDYLDAELRQAEVEFASLPRPVGRRSRGAAPLATLLGAAVVLLAATFAGSQLLWRANTGPAAIQLGADGLPISIDGQPVLRGDAIGRRAVTGGSFLAGGTLTLASDPCPAPAEPSAAPCMETWSLDDPAGAAPRFGLSGVASSPGFVHTSGALTVVRVDGLAGSTAAASPCVDCAGALSVEAVVWRRPTKGPMSTNATPPQGGPMFDAFVPDFVAAWNRDGTAIAGYVPKSYLIGPFPDLPGSPSSPPQEPPTPVYGDDLTTLVGHMVAGVGFVPLGASPAPGSPDASVAPSPAGSSSPAPAPSGAANADPTLVCGEGGVEFKASVLEAPAELTGPDQAIAALRSYLAGGVYPGMPADGWRTVVASDASVTFLTQGTATWWFVTMTPDLAGSWQDSEEGECRLAVRLPTTMSYAEWHLDPKHPPKPGDSSVNVLATEMSCANGRPPGERLQAPLIVETGTTVTITLLVRRLGNADCPSNPEVPVVVRLTTPLGTRALLDGSTYPAAER